MKKYVHSLIFTLCLWGGLVKANKFFMFFYDDNGNRQSLTFSSTCRIKNPNDTTATKADTTFVSDKEVLSQLQTVSEPKLYPTLVRTDFTISFPKDIANGTLQISNLQGNVLFTETGIITANTIVKMCDIAAGMYNVVVYYDDNKKFVQKIIKQ